MSEPAAEDEVSPELLARYARIGSGTLTTELYRRGYQQRFLCHLRPLHRGIRPFAGEAYTMRFIPAREDRDVYATLTPLPSANNLQWVGVEEVQPGQVLVIDSRGVVDGASAGNILLTRLKCRGAAAVVTDGSLRDGSEIGSIGLPAWASAVVATTRLAYHHVADLQVPIGCAGVAVYPKDIVVGDADGVTVVPRHEAAAMIDDCEQREEMEAYLAARIARGEALWGVYPASADMRARFEAWKAAGKPLDDDVAPSVRPEALL